MVHLPSSGRYQGVDQAAVSQQGQHSQEESFPNQQTQVGDPKPVKPTNQVVPFVSDSLTDQVLVMQDLTVYAQMKGIVVLEEGNSDIVGVLLQGCGMMNFEEGRSHENRRVERMLGLLDCQRNNLLLDEAVRNFHDGMGRHEVGELVPGAGGVASDDCLDPLEW